MWLVFHCTGCYISRHLCKLQNMLCVCHPKHFLLSRHHRGPYKLHLQLWLLQQWLQLQRLHCVVHGPGLHCLSPVCFLPSPSLQSEPVPLQSRLLWHWLHQCHQPVRALLCWFLCPGGNSNLSTLCPTNATSQPGASVVEQCCCPSGYYGTNGTNCMLCPPNNYCASSVLSQCPVNSFAPQKSFRIEDCQCKAGFYAANGVSAAGNYIVCPINSYCPPSSLTFTPCMVNEVTATVQTTSSDNCFCDRCYTGTNNSNCVACVEGQYCWNCQPPGTCPPNSTSPRLSSYLAHCSCNAGFYVVNMASSGACTACSAGSYALAGSSACVLCSAGSYSTASAAQTQATCQTCAVEAWPIELSAGLGPTMCCSCLLV